MGAIQMRSINQWTTRRASTTAAQGTLNFLSNSQLLLIRQNSTKNTQQQSSSSATTEQVVNPFVQKTLTCQSETGTKTRRKRKTKAWYAPYLALTKPRLTALVVLSAMSAYSLAPCETTLSQLTFLTIGTTLASGSANAINMAREHVFDGMMTRTRTRPVVRGLLSPRLAFLFAGVSGTVGVLALYFGVNPIVAALGAANIGLYGGLYTSMKRKTIANTWAGAIVGAIPPLMGWAASTGNLNDPGAWTLAALLYAWQFPHFMSLSHGIREEYRRAGHVMACWTNPALNARVALRYSIVMFPICFAMSYYGVTDWVFVLDSAILNTWLTYGAYIFWKEQRYNTKPVSTSGKGSGSARILFWGSVWHLPGVLVLAMLHKKGQWDWLFGKKDEETF
ncbi:hypothetical protein TRICI_001358 [Trichomonascus ciferrii]|uniref:Protoheme IX farnesyltransferase, mitochondrial n=1 Tax=Trichomonascus ciferrii TaxID=44093 RepID=A0A642VCG8_9ASCO|nr:hypothetical protein TRICI_001358 [Trichomonascus ciferrii]